MMLCHFLAKGFCTPLLHASVGNAMQNARVLWVFFPDPIGYRRTASLFPKEKEEKKSLSKEQKNNAIVSCPPAAGWKHLNQLFSL